MKTRILFAYLRQVSRGQRRRILLTCLTGIVGVGVSLAFIYASRMVIDIATGTLSGSLLHAALLTVVLLAAQLLCGAFDTWLSTRMQVETGNALRHRLFARLIQSRWNESERFHTGDVVNRIEQDTTAIVTLLTATLPSFITAVVQLAAAFVFFCLLDAWLPWIVIGILPFFLLGARFYLRRMRRFTRGIRQSDSRIQSVIQEGLQHRTVIKTLEQDDRHLAKLGSLQEELRGQVLGRMRFSLSAHLLAAAAFSGGYLTAFLWGAVRLSAGTITFGTMTAFLQLVGKIQQPAFDLSRLIPSLINALTAVERLLELEQLPAEETGKREPLSPTPDLLMEDVCFGYSPDDRLLLNHFSHRFAAGSHTAVLGETGAGKTTLVRLMLALIAPQSGRCVLSAGGQRYPLSPATRANFVYVPQGNTLFSGTIRDNLLMGNPDATDAELHRALRTACADFVSDLPEGIDTRLHEQGGGLSEGQAQRIAIARALLRPGRILLLDEATSALDRETEQLFIAHLKRECAGKTVIFITHHKEVADACDEVVRITGSARCP
ncbi:MAG: ABC transporter ATP-binding protein/permease [Prevotellaceae bacterium]|jgi:ABC-type multidrug transport system fused ATPase/permease subunit|nr:ABC transporter ATP-binding protein/permease [Prevotellaceae bacterium]